MLLLKIVKASLMKKVALKTSSQCISTANEQNWQFCAVVLKIKYELLIFFIVLIFAFSLQEFKFRISLVHIRDSI